MSTYHLTAQDCVLDLLRYVGVTGFTAPQNDQALNQPGLDSDDTRRAIVAVNSALQTIQKWGPQAMKFDMRSVNFPVPVSNLSFNIVSGAKTGIASGTPPAYINGCSILLDGDADLNRIMGISGTTVTFLRAYIGGTGAAIGSTIYNDCASVDADVQAIEEPGCATPNVRMYRAKDIDDFERFRQRWWIYGYPGDYGGVIQAIARNPGIPVRWIEERKRNGTLYLRVTPMPAATINVTFQAKLRAERIDPSALDLTGATDPNYIFTSIHDDEVESLLLPIARWRFFSHPALKNAESSARIKAEYDEAMSTLKSGMTFEPRVSDNIVRYI